MLAALVPGGLVDSLPLPEIGAGAALAQSLATSTVGPALAGELAKNGLLGLAVLALGVIAYRLILRETARADRAEAALAELNREIREKAIPALMESARATTDATQAVKDMAVLRERR
ncbi:MAG TPA: hypothetical protein VFM55_18890 [Micromonosporaceae bacterium]|nr:hypothetical protein [Micromonosporaceae bacterium]